MSFIEQQRRAQIARAAIATVNEVGYPGTSLSRIAEHAGISKSIISYHFRAKDELLLHVVDTVFAELGNAIMAALPTTGTSHEKLAAYIRSYLGHASAHRNDVLAAVEIVVSHRDADGTPMYLVEGEDDTAALRSIIGGGMRKGEFRQMDLDVAVTSVVHALDGALTRSRTHAETDLVAWGEDLVVFLSAALEPR